MVDIDYNVLTDSAACFDALEVSDGRADNPFSNSFSVGRCLLEPSSSDRLQANKCIEIRVRNPWVRVLCVAGIRKGDIQVWSLG